MPNAISVRLLVFCENRNTDNAVFFDEIAKFLTTGKTAVQQKI